MSDMIGKWTPDVKFIAYKPNSTWAEEEQIKGTSFEASNEHVCTRQPKVLVRMKQMQASAKEVQPPEHSGLQGVAPMAPTSPEHCPRSGASGALWKWCGFCWEWRKVIVTKLVLSLNKEDRWSKVIYEPKNLQGGMTVEVLAKAWWERQQ